VIYRAAKGATEAKVFIDVSATEGNVSFLGVLADGATNTLWACQIIGTGKNRHSILRSFDLTSGAPKLRWPLPGEINLCNDFVVGPDKALYIADTFGSKIFRLKPGASEPELLIEDRTLDGVDGITFLGNELYVNNVISNNLYRIPLDAAGKAARRCRSGPISRSRDRTACAPPTASCISPRTVTDVPAWSPSMAIRPPSSRSSKA